MVLQTGSDAILDHPTPAELPDDCSRMSDPSKSCRRTIQLNSAEIIDPQTCEHIRWLLFKPLHFGVVVIWEEITDMAANYHSLPFFSLGLTISLLIFPILPVSSASQTSLSILCCTCPQSLRCYQLNSTNIY